MANLPARNPCTIAVIAINIKSVLLLVMFKGGCCQIFHIWKIGFLVTNFGRFCVDLSDESLSEPFMLDFQSLIKWYFLTQLWQIATDLVDEYSLGSLSLPIRRLLNLALFAVFMTGSSISPVGKSDVNTQLETFLWFQWVPTVLR